MQHQNYICILFSVITLCLCLTTINYQIERTIKSPFPNNLTNATDIFTSPLSLIFFTSGIIWLSAAIYNCCTTTLFCNSQNQEDQPYDQNHLVELQFNRLNLQSHDMDQASRKQEKLRNSQNEEFAFNNLPKLQIFKIVISNFFQLICFFYGIQYLSFPKVMIFKIISRMGLTTLYESLFTEDSNKCKKFFISLISFAGFAIFNYSFVDSPQIQKDQKLYKDNIIYGYMFVIGMCYLGLMKKIFQRQVNETYGTWSGDGWILTQAKVNCVGAYLILLCLKQEIYGSVFAVLHTEFLLGILGLSILLAAVMQLKRYIVSSFTTVLGNFVGILQKNLSLIASVIFFGQGINSGQIVGVCIIGFAAFLSFLLGFSENDQSARHQSGKDILNQFSSSQNIFTKNDDIKDNDEKKSLKV